MFRLTVASTTYVWTDLQAPPMFGLTVASATYAWIADLQPLGYMLLCKLYIIFLYYILYF